jgi:ABC-type branched-subunit amino acid transport system substrate-binding protein
MKVILAGLMVLSLLVIPLLSACDGEQPPVEKTILVGAIQDFSGPTAQASGRLWTAAQEFFKWANETDYVPGVKVTWTQEDDKYDASQTPIAYRAMKAKNPPDVIFTMTAVSSSGLKPLVDEDKIPVISFTGSVATAQEPVGYVFQLTFVPEINFNCFLNYVADTWTETRPCKVASLSWDDNDGTQHINSGITTAAALGIDFKREYAIIAPPGTMDFTNQVTLLKELDPDYIFFPMIGPATGSAIKSMIAMGMDPKKAVYIVMSGGGMYEELTSVIGSEEPTHGATLVMADYAWSIQTPEQQQLKSFMEPTTYGWDARYHVNALSYYTSCKVLYEALRIAKDDVGVENIDSAAIYNALQKIKNFDTGVCLPVTFSTDNRLGVRSAYIYEIGTDSIPHLKTDKIYTWPQGHQINPAYPSE